MRHSKTVKNPWLRLFERHTKSSSSPALYRDDPWVRVHLACYPYEPKQRAYIMSGRKGGKGIVPVSYPIEGGGRTDKSHFSLSAGGLSFFFLFRGAAASTQEKKAGAHSWSPLNVTRTRVLTSPVASSKVPFFYFLFPGAVTWEGC